MQLTAPAVRPAETSAGWHSDAEVSGVMIGTPAYGGLVTSRYLTSAISTSQLLEEKLRTPDGKKLPVAWCVIDGESLVQRARNNIVARFMADPRLSHLVFIDADIEWTARDVLRLIGHDLDVIGGIYPKKTEPVEFPFHPLLDGQGEAKRNPVTGAIQIANAPTGFLCLKRRVFERMREAYPRLKFRCPKATETEAEWLYAYFDAYVEDGILWSEDYGFCRRWRELGGEIWCDPAIELGHVGTRIYHGSVASLWQEAKPADRPHGWAVPSGDQWFIPGLRDGGGEMDREVREAALAQVKDFTCAVDVGAHIGTWTKPLAGRFQQVVAMEPNAVMLPYLQANTEGLENVRIIPAAAWSEKRRLRLTRSVDARNSGEVMVEPTESGDGDTDGVPLDSLGLERVGLLKVDVEGAELSALVGAREILRRDRPVVVLEQHEGRAEAAEWLRLLGMGEVFRRPIAEGSAAVNVVMVWAA